MEDKKGATPSDQQIPLHHWRMGGEGHEQSVNCSDGKRDGNGCGDNIDRC